jgi:hypothetical protein
VPTFKQIEAAFLNAHNAGDTAAAQKLADALRSQMSAPDASASGLPKRGLGGTFSGGFNRGMSRLGSTFTDIIPAIAGSAIGADEYAQEQLAEAEEKQRVSAMLDPPQFQTFKEVDGLRSGLGFAAETMAEQVGNMGVALATGLTGGAAAPALLGGRALASAATTGAARSLAAKTVAQQAATGTAAGAYLGSYALNAPEVFENIYRETGETAPGTALLFSTLSAGLDAVLPAALASKMTGPLKLGVVQNLLARSGMKRGALRSGAAGLATGLGIEGVTEGAQEGISIAAERFVDENPEVFGSKEWDRIIESSVRGAVAGGGFGTAGGGIGGVREGVQRKQRLGSLEEARALRNQIRSKYEVPAEQQPEGMTPTSGAQQGLSFVDPVNLSQSPEEIEESLQAAREEVAAAEVETTDFKVPVTASLIYALETAKRRGKIPAEVKLKKLDEAQTKIVENIQQEESQRVLYADATVEAQRRGVEFDANKAPNELSEEEQILLGEVAESRVGRYGKSQQSLFTMDGAPVKQTNKQKRAEKAAVAESFRNLSVIPTDKAGLRAWGKENFGLGPTAAILREDGPLAGKNLSNPVEAAQVKADLAIVKSKSTSTTVPVKIDEFFARLESQAKPAVPVEEVGVEGSLSDAQIEEGFNKVNPLVNANVDQTTTAARPTPKFTPSPETNALEEETTSAVKKLTGEDGKPLVLYRGSASSGTEGVPEAALRGEPRQGYAVFVSTSPYVAATYGTAVTPLHVYADEVIEFPVRVGRDGSRSFSFTKFDEAANKLPANTVLVARQVYDSGPMADKSIDPEMFYTYPSDIYALGNGTKTTSALSEPSTIAKPKAQPEEATAKAKPKAKPKAAKPKPKPKPKPKLAGPIYKGKNLNTETIEAVEKGRLAPALSQLTNTVTNPEVKRVLRKIKSLGLTSKLVIAPVQGAAGTYDPNTNTITLDPVTGLNEHTFIHELIHAVLQKVIATPTLQITKDLTDFYASIYSRLGDTYGTKNLQEFVAEFIANPEFQALLKTIDAPRGGNWVTRIAKTIAEFFGFRKKQSAYKAGLKFISDAVDISSGVEAVPGEVLLLGPGTNLGNMIEFGTNSKAELSQAVNNFKGDTVKKAMFAFVSLRNMIKLYGDKVVDATSRELLPILQTNVESKRGAISLGVEKASEGIRKVKELEQNATPAQIAERNSIAFDASKAGVDIREPATRDPAFKVTADNRAEFDALRVRYNRLPKELRESYNIIRADLDANFKKWIAEISNSDIPRSTQQKIKDEFTSMGVVGYVPRTRPGKYALEFDGGTTNKKEERVVTSFRDVTERDAAFDILEGQKKKPQRYSFVPSKAPSAQGLPTASFIRGVVSEMRAAGVDEKVIDNVYQYYIDQQGASALTKQLTVKSKMLEGFDTDLTRAYADQMYKWVHMLTNLKYNPKISETFRDIAKTIKANGTITTNRNLSANQRENLEAALSSLAMQETFMLNPNFNGVTSFLTYSSYIGFIAGSVSSAVVNLTGLIFMVYPSLASRFGYDNALREMKDASQATFITKDWSKGKYAALYTYLDSRSLLRQTTDMEIIDRAKGEAKGALSSFDKVIKFASIPFAASERMQRAITAVAAYELAIKSKDSNYNTPEKAMEYAANQIRDAHSAGISDVAPRAFQHNIGRVILTFKQIVFTQAATLAFTFARALPNSGLSAEEKSIARHQFLATFGISGALLGVGGLPFFGLYTTLARMLEFMIPDDEDAPYDPKQQLRDVTNSFIYNGLIAELFNIEISERAQLANNIVWRDDSYSVAKYGYLNTFLLSLFGPMGSAAQSTQGGLQEIAKGNWGRGVEDMSPLALRNLLKGIRYAREGATTRGGDIVEEDIGLLSSLIQMTGFTPASLADTQMQRSAAKNYEVEVLTRKQEIFDNYETGYNTGDKGRMRKAEREARNFIRQYPDLMDSESLKRSLRDRKARDEKKIRGQMYSQGLLNTLDDIYAIRS